MGPCNTIIDSICLSPNSFFLHIVELTEGLYVGNTLFYFRGEMKQRFLMHLLLLSLFGSTFYVFTSVEK